MTERKSKRYMEHKNSLDKRLAEAKVPLLAATDMQNRQIVCSAIPPNTRVTEVMIAEERIWDGDRVRQRRCVRRRTYVPESIDRFLEVGEDDDVSYLYGAEDDDDDDVSYLYDVEDDDD